MNVMTDIRELRRQNHENRRRDLCLRTFRHASVAEVDEAWECNGLCRAHYESGVRVVLPAGGCEYHRGRT